MGAEQAVKTLTEVRVASLRRQGHEPDPGELDQIRDEVGDYFERTSNPYHLTSELRDDGLIDPVRHPKHPRDGALGDVQRAVRAHAGGRAENLGKDPTP